MKHLSWKGDFNQYSIFSDWKIAGYLRKGWSSRQSSAELNGKRFLLSKGSIFSRNTTVFNPDTGDVLGSVYSNSWGNRGTFSIGEHTYSWTSGGFFQRDIKIFNAKGVQLELLSRFDNGQANFLLPNEDEELLFVCGLNLLSFISHYSLIMALSIIFIIILI